MLSLLLAVQHSVTREDLGVATSLNFFARSIGGAVGVAIMGAILAAGLAGRLTAEALRSDGLTGLGPALRQLVGSAVRRRRPTAGERAGGRGRDDRRLGEGVAPGPLELVCPP